MRENLNLRLLGVSPDVLKLSAVNITELATPVGTAAPGNRTADGESGIMARAFESYRTVLRGGGVHVLRFPWRLCARRAVILLTVKSRITATHMPVEVREVKEKHVLEIGALCLRLGIISVSTFLLRVSSIRTFPPFRKFTDSHNVPCACVMGNLV